MLEKYNQLKSMLSVKYNISAFDDLSITEEYFIVDTNKENICISVFAEENNFEIIIEEKKEEDWELIESKKYKNVKSAYNFIKKFLED